MKSIMRFLFGPALVIAAWIPVNMWTFLLLLGLLMPAASVASPGAPLNIAVDSEGAAHVRDTGAAGSLCPDSPTTRPALNSRWTYS